MTKTYDGNNPGDLEQRLKLLSQGTKAVLTSVPSIDVDGVPVTPAAAATMLDGWVLLFTTADGLHASLTKAILDRNNATPQILAFVKSYEEGLRAKLGSSSAALEQFGLTPTKKRADRTSAEKAASAAQGALTRQLRGTKGSKQKASIKAPPAPSTKPAKPASPPAP
jgi:hypothetical protein